VFPGRTAEPSSSEPDTYWVVYQEIPTEESPSRTISIMVNANTEQEALEKARLKLPYWPEQST
jgi:hypothetical protein